MSRHFTHLHLHTEYSLLDGPISIDKLISYSYQTGFYFKPRIDYSILEKHSEGLIATSACLGGHIPKLLMAEDATQLNQRLDWFLNVFGRDRFFLEVQPEDQQEQKILN